MSGENFKVLFQYLDGEHCSGLAPQNPVPPLTSFVPQADPVNHPSHYNKHPSGIEAIQVVRHMNFNIGNAMKYLWRAGLKDGQPEIQDLEKAIWYINDEICRIKIKNM